VENDVATKWYSELDSLSTWYRPTIKVYGKSILQSREIAAYATDPNLIHKYSGTIVDMHTDYPAVITAIQSLVESALSVQFNHVMLNRYASGDVYIGLHSDNLENRIIATLSLGVERTFILRHRTIESGEGKKIWKLGNGSLFVMQGDTQRFWKHEIPRERNIASGRISLTFRQLAY
jgi:alkylated DNA repair dioxygenase AlkB